MTSRERFLTALRNQVPDRVPVTPDISTMIPAKRTGLPFWDVFFYGKADFQQAFLDASDYFGLDCWTAGHMWVDMLVEHTHVSCINPLEVAPMGDIDLAEVKQARGKQIALMGNLHTTDLMLRGSPKDVEEACIQAMRDAGSGRGFILSSGDQCPRDTPEENLFAMVEAVKKYGAYDQETGQLPNLPPSGKSTAD